MGAGHLAHRAAGNLAISVGRPLAWQPIDTMKLPDSALAMKLPVSGLEVRFRAPDGNDDLAILEVAGGPVERALVVVPRLARLGNGDAAPRWAGLTVTDFEVALLGLRRSLFGDRVACVFRCSSARCGERMELEFSVAVFLEDVKPSLRRLKGIEKCDGWFGLAGPEENRVRFRLPVVEDQVQVVGLPRADRLLMERCIEAKNLNARELARIERAMEAMSPLVSRPLSGTCRACGEQLRMPLHVPRLVMDELRMSAVGVHDEIHAIAQTYHWDEATILAMPQSRRQTYAETIRRQVPL